MEVVCGCCRWCREPVRRAEGRYAAVDGAVVHEECMEEFLLEALGLRRLAAQAGYRYERGEDTDAEGRKRRAAGLVPVLPGGQWEEHFLRGDHG